MAEECAVDGNVCGLGRGFCFGGNCVCQEGYVSSGDFLKSNTCQVHFDASKALWGIAAFIWITLLLLSCYAITRLERRTKEALVFELGILMVFVVASVCHIILACLEASASTPGAFSVGIEPTVTSLFAVGNTLVLLFLCLNPLSKSQTGVGSLALARVKHIRSLYVKTVPILIATSICVSFLPFGSVYGDPSANFSVASAFFIIEALLLIFVAIQAIVSLWMMHRDFTKALTSSTHDLPPSHRHTIERVAQSTRKVIVIPIVGAAIFGPMLFAFGLPFLVRQVWVGLPLITWISSLWMLRYVNRSIKASHLVHNNDKDKTSFHFRPTEEVETKNSSGNEKPATDSNSSSLSSNNQTKPKQSRRARKTFRLKGFKSKPMELMSQVTEGNSEGTVRFTEVDGVTDIMGTSSSRYSRPITLSTKIEMSPRPTHTSHTSLSSVQSTLWEVDIGGGNESNGSLN
jgi:hypothetical protein